MWCFWCWNKEIIFLLCVTPYSERQVTTFRKTYSVRHFLSPFLFVSFVMSLCCLLFLEQVPIAILWHYKKNWFESLFLDSSAGFTRGCWVSWLTAVTENTSLCCPLLTECSFVLNFISVAARSRAWVFGHSFAWIACSKSVGGIDVPILWVLCVVR
jgi:hypothetical protein